VINQFEAEILIKQAQSQLDGPERNERLVLLREMRQEKSRVSLRSGLASILIEIGRRLDPQAPPSGASQNATP
jgi:hypothetical protein